MQIYKYLSPDRASFLLDSMLRFSPPAALNDPFELLPGITETVVRDLRTRMRHQLLIRPIFRPAVNRTERRVANRENKRKATQVFREIDLDDVVEKPIRHGIENINAKLGILYFISALE